MAFRLQITLRRPTPVTTQPNKRRTGYLYSPVDFCPLLDRLVCVTYKADYDQRRKIEKTAT